MMLAFSQVLIVIFEQWGSVKKEVINYHILPKISFLLAWLIHDKYQINLNAKYLSKMRSKKLGQV